MTQNYTLEDLVRLVYKDATTDEVFALSRAMESDYALREEYHELKDASKTLPKVTFSPTDSCINDILQYSRRTASLQVEI